MSDQVADLRERVLNLVLNKDHGWSWDEVTDAILAVVPDPRRSIGANHPPESIAEPESEEERLLQIDPENLVAVSTDKLVPLFQLHYPALAERAATLKQVCEQWQADHKTQAAGWIDIKDDAENANVADLMRQMDDFSNEVDETRKRVKLSVFEAGQRIDGWFTRNLAEPVVDIRGVTRTVSGKRYAPGPGTMQFSQTKYLTDKAERERQAREAAATAARVEEARKADEARQMADQEKQRIADLEAQGLDRSEAQEIAQSETDKAAAHADAARESSALIGSYASASTNEMVRQHTATGTTVGLSGKWVFDTENVNMIELCLAVGAPGLLRSTFIEQVASACLIGPAAVKVILEAAARILMPNGAAIPATFVATDDKNIRAAITARTAPLREAPGLRIYQEMSARRRGG